MTDINIGAITESLNYKSDLDLGNTSPQLVDYIVEQQLPTAENNYTWYDLYKSGKVRQGGFKKGLLYQLTIDLPIEMADLNYTSIAVPVGETSNNLGAKVYNYSTTQIKTTTTSQGDVMWTVEGMSAGV